MNFLKTYLIVISLIALSSSAYAVITSPAYVDDSGNLIASLPNMPMGEVSINDNLTATVITTSSTWTLFNETTSLSGLDFEFDSPQAGRIRYTGTTTKNFHCGVTISISPTNNNDTIKAVIYKNGGVNGSDELTSGTALTSGIVETKLGTSTDVQSTAIHVFVQLVTNDYVELALQNTTGTGNLTIKHANIFCLSKQ